MASPRFACLLAPLLALATPAPAHAGEPDTPDSTINRASRAVALRLHAEAGLLGAPYHRIRFGVNGTHVDVRKDFGQDLLFPYLRSSADLDLGRARRHTAIVLYQPLVLESELPAPRQLRFYDTTLPAGTPIAFRYGFSFWRASYLYDLLPDARELAIGLSLQLRNADIRVRSLDGSFSTSLRDVGPVPLLKLRGRGHLRGPVWIGGEIDGFYAPIRYLNGGRSDVEGAIVDASFRAGVTLDRGVDAYLNLRWLGGGASGTSSRPEPFTDGFSSNWLHFVTLGIGLSLR